MDELEMLEKKVIPTDLFGDLLIKSVLVEYEYPRCFICQNNKGQLFALVENDDSHDSFGWNMSVITKDDINLVNRGLKDVQSLFKNKSNYYVNASTSSLTCSVIRTNSFSGKNEINGSLFVKDFCEMDEIYDFHLLQKKSIDSKKSLISLVLEGNESSLTGTIMKIINYVKSICTNLSNKLDINDSRFSVQNGSTVITFEFGDDNIKLSESVDPIKLGIIELGNMLGANEPNDLISNNDSPVPLRKYGKLIETFYKEKNIRPKVVLSLPDRIRSTSYDFGKKSCITKRFITKQAQSILKDKFKVEEKEFFANGLLTGILTGGRNQFSFKDNAGVCYSGTVDFALIDKENQFNVNGTIYNATILRTKITNGSYNKVTFKLRGLKKIRDIEQYKSINLL